METTPLPSDRPTPTQQELSESALALKTTNQIKRGERPQGGSKKRRQPQPNFGDLIADRFLNREEASAYLGMTVSALAHDVVHGRYGIPYHRFGNMVRYRRSELDAWAAERRRIAGNKVA
jgi:hypothetical protein